jgi:hypothetical protein
MLQYNINTKWICMDAKVTENSRWKQCVREMKIKPMKNTARTENVGRNLCITTQKSDYKIYTERKL